MQISLETNAGAYTIRSYAAGELKINDQTLHHSVIVTPTQLIDPWDPNDLAIILTLNPEIVLLGTGERLKFPAAELLAPFLQRGIGIECMDTGAACRTFNVLVSEGRQVVAALMLSNIKN
jgi:uncharacterized protein